MYQITLQTFLCSQHRHVTSSRISGLIYEKTRGVLKLFIANALKLNIFECLWFKEIN